MRTLCQWIEHCIVSQFGKWRNRETFLTRRQIVVHMYSTYTYVCMHVCIFSILKMGRESPLLLLHEASACNYVSREVCSLCGSRKGIAACAFNFRIPKLFAKIKFKLQNDFGFWFWHLPLFPTLSLSLFLGLFLSLFLWYYLTCSLILAQTSGGCVCLRFPSASGWEFGA